MGALRHLGVARPLLHLPQAKHDQGQILGGHVVQIDGDAIEPSVTWGIHPGQNLGVGESLPRVDDVPRDVQVLRRELGKGADERIEQRNPRFEPLEGEAGLVGGAVQIELYERP